MAITLVAEIGINHNGYLDRAKLLIDHAVDAGFDFVKFQKRTPALCVPEKQKNTMKETPWGQMKYIDYRERLEFGFLEYESIKEYCEKKNIEWFASAWDIPSAQFLRRLGRKIIKIPSAKLTDIDLIKYCREKFPWLIISTGMSTEAEIQKAYVEGQPNVIMHSVSIYPTKVEDSMLNYIRWLKNKYPVNEIGYSGHEEGTDLSVAAVACGATWIERHITLDKNSWGSDQLMSLEYSDMRELVKKIRMVEKALTDGYSQRIVLEGEKMKKEQLRG